MMMSPMYGNASSYQGKVTNVTATGGKIIITLQNGSGSASCGSANGTRYYLDPSVDIDKVVISLAITAKVADKLVWVMGNGSCIAGWPYYDAEKLTDFDFKG